MWYVLYLWCKFHSNNLLAEAESTWNLGRACRCPTLPAWRQQHVKKRGCLPPVFVFYGSGSFCFSSPFASHKPLLVCFISLLLPPRFPPSHIHGACRHGNASGGHSIPSLGFQHKNDSLFLSFSLPLFTRRVLTSVRLLQVSVIYNFKTRSFYNVIEGLEILFIAPKQNDS